MITKLNRKLLEKKSVQNHLATYEVQISHFFYNANATVSFLNRLTLSISIILLDTVESGHYLYRCADCPIPWWG